MQSNRNPGWAYTGRYAALMKKGREREREREREDKTRQDKIILLSGLRPITTGVNIQVIRILMDPMTDLNSLFQSFERERVSREREFRERERESLSTQCVGVWGVKSICGQQFC